MYYIQCCFFNSGGGIDDMYVKLSLIEQIIKMLIWWAFHSVLSSLFNMTRIISNMYTYPFNQQLIIKYKSKIMTRNQKVKGTFICGPLFFKWMGISQSSLDCFSIGAWAFIHYSNINFFIFRSLCMLVSICYNFKML